MTALITTANSPKALIATRSLGKKGIDVDTADKQKFALSSLSKYSRNFFLYPSPKDHPQEFISTLISIIKKFGHDVLIPVHSEDTYIIAKYKSKLEQFIKVPLHDYPTIMNVNNKGYLLKAADELGIPIPHTYFIDKLDDLLKVADKTVFPAVIKLKETSSSIGLSYVNSKEELISRYKDTVFQFNLSPSNYPLIQEYVEGTGYGVSLLFNQGDLRARFTHKRLREYPITGGPATYRVSTTHPQMEKIAIDLLTHFRWHGLAMVEFKVNRDNRPVLMEINPRVWGSVNQAVQSGVDFPYLLYMMALEGDVKPVLDYKVGIKTKNSLIDYIAIYRYFMKDYNKNIIKEFFSFPHNDDILSFEDPLPVLGFVGCGFKELLHSRYS
jgi:predicted ATP-grasp superfamily ATP-dependent carboligase